MRKIAKLIALIIIITAANGLSRMYTLRVDLTADKRYSLSDASKQVLQKLDKDIFIKVYLEGDDLPSGFKRLKNSIQMTLGEFQAYAGNHLKFTFIDPNDLSKEGQKELAQNLNSKGINPTQVSANRNGDVVQKTIFPGAIIYCDDQETGVQLLSGDQKASLSSPEHLLNQSVENIEYEFISNIQALTQGHKKTIGFIYGHGELNPIEIQDMTNKLSENYLVQGLRLPEISDLTGLSAIIIAKPTQKFSEEDKYKIDQYIMNGGKALFLIDALDIKEDSIVNGTYSFPYTHNLGDLLFRYGIRINPDFVKDLSAAVRPMVTGTLGDQQRIQMVPWTYFPLLNNLSEHPIVRNLDAIFGKYMSTIDTVKTDKIIKTPLLTTSPYTQVLTAPVEVTFNEAQTRPDTQDYHEGLFTVAYLLEGNFTSLYQNRITPSDQRHDTFKPVSVATKIIVCSDGDLIRNEVIRKSDDPSKVNIVPLGYDRYTQTQFANKKFIKNAIDYLTDDDGLILARRKQVVLRPLDKQKIENERSFWQWINVLSPIILVVLFGLIRYQFRKMKYT